MKYWVYINDQVLPQPYEAEELSSIPGFDEQTYICPEVTPEGQEQQWSAAGELLNFGEPEPVVPAAPEEPVYEEPVYEENQEVTDTQEVYDASAEYTPEPLPVSYGNEEGAHAQASEREQILLEKIEFLINEVADLKKDIANLNQAAAMTLYAAPAVQDTSAANKNNGPVIKDAEALKAFNAAPLIPLNENDIPEEKLDDKKISLSESEPGEPVVLKASDDESLPKDENTSDDILESAIENTIRLKTVPESIVAPVAFDLASKQTIEISTPEEEKEEKPVEPEKIESAEPKAEKVEEIVEEKAAAPEPAVEEVHLEQLSQEQAEPAAAQPEAAAEEPEVVAEPEKIETAEEEPASSEDSSDAEILEIASVGNTEEESILKTFAEEKKEEEAKEEAQNKEYEALEKDLSGGIEDIAEPIDEPASEPAFEQIASEPVSAQPDMDAQPENVEPEVIENLPPQEEAIEEPVIESAEEVVDEPAENQPDANAQYEDIAASEPDTANAEAAQGEVPAPAEEEVNSLESLTAPSAGEAQEQGTAQVDNVDDKFLKTFTSSIEEVFLDQPTSIISDYVPPTITSDSPLYSEDSVAPAPAQAPQPGQPGMADLKNNPSEGENSSVRQVRRIKPAAIKTVPMVAAGDPIGADYNTPNIEEAIAELNAPSPFMKGLKAFILMMVLLCAVLGFVAVLAIMGILPKEMSPVHYIIDKVSGPGVEETIDLQESTKLPADTEDEAVEEESTEDLITKNIINTVKNYTFVDGWTLADKIKTVHKNSADLIQWSAEPSVDPSYYSIAVKLPPNNEGYSLTYRFSYNTTDGSLVPTTSESNNIMTMVLPKPTPAPAPAAAAPIISKPTQVAGSGSVRSPARGR